MSGRYRVTDAQIAAQQRAYAKALRLSRADLRNEIMAKSVGADQVRRAGFFCWDEIKGRRASARRFIVVRSWSRDCDGTEGGGVTAYPATRRQLWLVSERKGENAEGPWSLEILTRAEVAALDGAEP